AIWRIHCPRLFRWSITRFTRDSSEITNSLSSHGFTGFVAESAASPSALALGVSFQYGSCNRTEKPVRRVGNDLRGLRGHEKVRRYRTVSRAHRGRVWSSLSCVRARRHTHAAAKRPTC